MSIQEICRKAGVSRSSFYTIFSGKDDIITHMIQNVTLDFHKRIPAFLAEANDFERIVMIINAYLSLGEEYGSELSRIAYAHELTNRSRNLLLLKAFDDTLLQLIRNCQQKGIARNTADPEQLLRIIFNIARSENEDWAIENGSFDLKERVRQEYYALFDVAPEFRRDTHKSL